MSYQMSVVHNRINCLAAAIQIYKRIKIGSPVIVKTCRYLNQSSGFWILNLFNFGSRKFCDWFRCFFENVGAVKNLC